MAQIRHQLPTLCVLLIAGYGLSCETEPNRAAADAWTVHDGDQRSEDLLSEDLRPADLTIDLARDTGPQGSEIERAMDLLVEEGREQPLDAVPSCEDGYGIRDGGDDCIPVTELCEDGGPCIVPEIGPGGTCAYVTLPDGEPCPPSDDPCVVSAQCVAGECVDSLTPCQELRPLLLVHGVNGSSANFTVMIQRLVDDGWPAEWIYAFDAEDPSWGCNVDNAAAIQALAEQAMFETCQPRIDLVAHSMGTLSSRYFVKNLGGAEKVNTYVTLGGMHHGLLSSCFAPDFLGVCVWQEICQWGDFVTQLNADPATPGPCNWVSIYSTADETISADSSQLDGAENIEFQGVAHDGPDGLLEDPGVYAELKRVLQYPCW